MNIFTKIKNLFTKVKTKIEHTQEDIINYFDEHATQIAMVMKIMDTFYDNLKGSEKMKFVIAFFISAANNKFKTNINPTDTANAIVTGVEAKFEEIYQREVKIAEQK